MPKQLSLVVDRPDVVTDAAFERLYTSMHAFSRRLQATGRRWWQPTTALTRSELHVLRMLAAHGECRSKDIADHFEVGPGVVSRQVTSLEEHGMVERRRDPHDGRAELVRPTARGREVLAAMRAAYTARLRELFVDWDSDRLEAAADLVDELADSLTMPLDHTTHQHTTHQYAEDHA